VRDLLPARFTAAGGRPHLARSGTINALLGDRVPRPSRITCVVEDRHAVVASVAARPTGAGKGRRPAASGQYLGTADSLLGAAPVQDAPVLRRVRCDPRPARASDIGGRPHAVSADARVRGGELIVLSGRRMRQVHLLRAIAARPPAPVEVGYVMQDGARLSR